MSGNKKYFNQNQGDSFRCAHCGRMVSQRPSGSRNRNHCPFCLWSLHVDMQCGDRLSTCKSLMEPIGIYAKSDGEWNIIHRCCTCGFLRSNRIAGDDKENVLLSLVLKPVLIRPFPAMQVLSEIAKSGTSGGAE